MDLSLKPYMMQHELEILPDSPAVAYEVVGLPEGLHLIISMAEGGGWQVADMGGSQGRWRQFKSDTPEACLDLLKHSVLS
jgi:hypothetical protein